MRRMDRAGRAKRRASAGRNNRIHFIMMQKLLGLAAAILIVAGIGQPASALDVKVVKSPKGVTAWLVTDRTAPVLHVAFAFRPGALRDPVGKEGLTNLMTTL